ncbi:MAG: hypothetical protein K5679_00015 [Lachnospiraceae bacterium]|nr:hypothetical protein [Lachnospiraceae bacterium]
MFMVLAYRLLDEENKKLVDADATRYTKWDKTEKLSRAGVVRKALKYKEFRSVILFRLRKGGRLARTFGKIGSWFYPTYKSIELGGEIGGGIYVSHSFSAVYAMAGKNLRIGPGVVVGRVGKYFPHIGDNVYLAANSTVIGNVIIGNNVIVGAGSVVTKDIPDNSVVVGNPARVIREIKEEDLAELM